MDRPIKRGRGKIFPGPATFGVSLKDTEKVFQMASF